MHTQDSASAPIPPEPRLGNADLGDARGLALDVEPHPVELELLLEVDELAGGLRSLAELEKRFGALPPGARVPSVPGRARYLLGKGGVTLNASESREIAPGVVARLGLRTGGEIQPAPDWLVRLVEEAAPSASDVLTLPAGKDRPGSAPVPFRSAAGSIRETWDAYGLEVGSNGKPLANLDAAMRVFEYEKPDIYLEEFTQQIRCKGRELRDDDEVSFALYMQRRIGLAKMTPQVVGQALREYARRRARDHMVDWLGRLTWDGVERCAGFLSCVYGAPDSEYIRAASGNFWKSLGARAIKPGCKVDTMLVLEGVQGLRKSSSLRALVGSDLFAEASEAPTHKDFFLSLQGKLLVEVAEMDTFSRSEVTAVKRVLSCQIDRYRPPYAKAPQDFPRRGVFVGTTNRDDWQRDETGGRRFWPIRCVKVDLEYIETHREQLFAEAVHRVLAGEAWWEMPQAATEAEQAARLSEDAWDSSVAAWLDALPSGAEVKTADVLAHALGLEPVHMGRSAEMRVAQSMRRLGWERIDAWREGRKARVWRRGDRLEGLEGENGSR
jgi:putative DNA primase/helicase